jgi:hypothetical protein
MSGHGNSEEYRDFRTILIDKDGSISCPTPTKNYEPSCRRAGKIIENRCLAEGNSKDICSLRRQETSQNFTESRLNRRGQTVGQTKIEEWLNAGQ